MSSLVSLPAPLCGIVPPVITALDAHGGLDEAGFAKQIERLVAGGVAGVFVLGTTGEGPSLSHAVQRQAVEVAVRTVAGRVPILVGITDPCFGEAVAFAKFAADAGAAALVAAPPFYFPLATADLVGHFRRFADALPLPLFLYNMPSHTKLHLEPHAVAELAEHPRIVGVKDSSGRMVYLNRLLLALGGRPDFTILVGPEELLAESVLLGAHGGVCGGANLRPRLYVELYESAVRRDLERVRALQREVMTLTTAADKFGANSFVRCLKAVLAEWGVCEPHFAEPLPPLTADERTEVRAEMRRLGMTAPE